MALWTAALALALALAITTATCANLLPEAHLTRTMQSRGNDAKRQPLKYYPFNHHRCRYILNAFYLHCNMHSEVYSLFESLLREMEQWMKAQDAQGGVSMNQLHELMTIARRAADELETISDYRRRAGFRQGDQKSQQELAMIAVVPAVIATMNIPQRMEVKRQLCTIAPRACPTIEQFAEYVRMFAGKPWKPAAERNFTEPGKGPLSKSIRRLIAMAADGEQECVTEAAVDDVDQVAVGMESAMLAALFNGDCSKSVPTTTAAIESFTKWASQVRVPRVAMEAARPLHALRHEFLHYMAAIPPKFDGVVKAVTRAVNEKRDIADIAAMVRDMACGSDGTSDSISDSISDGTSDSTSGGTSTSTSGGTGTSTSTSTGTSEVIKPLVLAPLAFVSSLTKTLDLASVVMPAQPHTYRLLTALAFSSLQGGDDYYKLAEQVDHQHHMQRRTGTLLSNNVAAYLRVPMEPAEQLYYRLLDRATRKGFKALAWSKKVRADEEMVLAIATVAASFPETPADTAGQTAIDYWHALTRYTLAARTPFGDGAGVVPSASVNNVDLAGEFKRAASCLPPPQYALYITHLLLDNPLAHTTVSKGDVAIASLIAKAALLCGRAECVVGEDGRFLAVVSELASADPVSGWAHIVGREEVRRVVKSRLAAPNMQCDYDNMQALLAARNNSKEPKATPKNRQKPVNPQLKQIINDTLSRTKQQSLTDYMWSCAALLQDTVAGRLPDGIVDKWPNAVLMTFIHGRPSARQKIIVALGTDTEVTSTVQPRDLIFVNHHQLIKMYPPRYAVRQATAAHGFRLPGDRKASRFLRRLRAAIQSEAVSE